MRKSHQQDLGDLEIQNKICDDDFAELLDIRTLIHLFIECHSASLPHVPTHVIDTAGPRATGSGEWVEHAGR